VQTLQAFWSVLDREEQREDREGVSPDRSLRRPNPVGQIVEGSGVCAVLIGDHPEDLVKDLQDRFPKANLIGDESGYEEMVAKVVGLIEAPSVGLDLPLDIQGTAFQQRVWNALQRIPVGSTASYADIAKQLGMPKSVRAIAQACAANSIAVAIPCHRVVKSDGKLSGYRWGVERKRTLLEREARA
jgi:AraC family transcriptional regulator of adaptative response/methylated-DNA-[protein]-cysteine methyltransferase